MNRNLAEIKESINLHVKKAKIEKLNDENSRSVVMKHDPDLPIKRPKRDADIKPSSGNSTRLKYIYRKAFFSCIYPLNLVEYEYV